MSAKQRCVHRSKTCQTLKHFDNVISTCCENVVEVFESLTKCSENLTGDEFHYLFTCFHAEIVKRVWRYQRGNQNPYIEEEQTTQWPKEKVQKDKQRSTKHTYTIKDRATRTPLKPGVNSGAPEG